MFEEIVVGVNAGEGGLDTIALARTLAAPGAKLDLALVVIGGAHTQVSAPLQPMRPTHPRTRSRSSSANVQPRSRGGPRRRRHSEERVGSRAALSDCGLRRIRATHVDGRATSGPDRSRIVAAERSRSGAGQRGHLGGRTRGADTRRRRAPRIRSARWQDPDHRHPARRVRLRANTLCGWQQRWRKAQSSPQ